MPTEPQPITLAEVVHKAVEACDDSSSDALSELLARFEDDDEPITGVEDVEARLDAAIGPPEFDDGDAAVTMARAVILYLAHRRDELGEEPVELLRLAARAEFHGKPPAHVQRWLSEQGIEV
jgi:hypothetical protein